MVPPHAPPLAAPVSPAHTTARTGGTVQGPNVTDITARESDEHNRARKSLTKEGAKEVNIQGPEIP